MGFRPAQFLLVLLLGWTVIGIAGVTLSLLREQHRKALRNAPWIAGAWIGYLGVLLCVSLLQPQKIVPVGTPWCIHDLCYRVAGSEDLPGYLTDNSRLVRVTIAITNRSNDAQQESHMNAFLLDTSGKRWNEIRGLSGIPLNARVQPGQTLTSAPVFKLPRTATPATVGFVHPRPYFGLLVIGDGESFLHRPTLLRLAR